MANITYYRPNTDPDKWHILKSFILSMLNMADTGGNENNMCLVNFALGRSVSD